MPEDVEGVMSASGAGFKLYSGRTLSPWRIFLNDANTAQVISGTHTNLPSQAAKATVVDKDIQGDAIRVEVRDDQKVALMIGDGPDFNFKDYHSQGVMNFDLKVDKAGSKGAEFSLKCGADCHWSMDLTKAFKTYEGKGWGTVSIPLKCLEGGKGDMSALSESFRLSTYQADYSVANIAVKMGQGDLSCSVD